MGKACCAHQNSPSIERMVE